MEMQQTFQTKKNIYCLNICTSLIMLGVAIYFIILYAQNKHSYCTKPIGTFLLVSGITSLFAFFFGILSIPSADERSNKTSTCQKLFSCFSSLIGLFSFIWFIIGSVWTFSIEKDDCPVFYPVSFWYLIITFILLGVSCCLICCCAFCCFYFYRSHKELTTTQA
eukprot:TRINITY_DN1883_c0_g1_i2.p1 TRINITY_DN1883_c0_g1~~TRINITY_DN1883_c0_g1_i2.p1  ORF type:complete len:164 (-),score=6.72 TRINITY_DN1883_c0_g1_i2:55-546(-)